MKHLRRLTTTQINFMLRLMANDKPGTKTLLSIDKLTRVRITPKMLWTELRRRGLE